MSPVAATIEAAEPRHHGLAIGIQQMMLPTLAASTAVATVCVDKLLLLPIATLSLAFVLSLFLIETRPRLA